MAGFLFAHAVYTKAVLFHGEKKQHNYRLQQKAMRYPKGKQYCLYIGFKQSIRVFSRCRFIPDKRANKMCAFMLHQASEQVLHTMLQIKTGLRVVTHNLDKLYCYCRMICYQLPEIVLSCNKENDKRLFNLLQKAYIDTRYKSDYNISIVDLLLITRIVRKLSDFLKKCI